MITKKIIYYKSKTCGACELMTVTGQLDDLSRHFDIDILVKEDTEFPKWITSLPTLVVKCGDVEKTYTGFTPAEQIIKDFINA